MKNKNQILCPECGTSINVSEALSLQLEQDISQKLHHQLNQQKEKLHQQQIDLEQQKQQEQELVEKLVVDQLKQKEKQQKQRVEEKLKTEFKDQFEEMQKELSEKSLQVKELNQQKMQNAKLIRAKDELESKIQAKAEQQLNQQLKQEREKISQIEKQKNELSIRELQKQLEDQKHLTEEMQRKHEQGSMQLQGEVQELIIEEWLTKQYPMDEIIEIKKGAIGGDCLQKINTRSQQKCGTIYYESKRTKAFQPQWIEKFKKDIQAENAHIGVLVTQSMPVGMKRMGQIEGVWVCSFEEFKGLSQVLRTSIIQYHSAKKSQENKGDKMVILYDFLTSNAFKLQIEAIVEGFSHMKLDLDKEKRAMQRLWKTREAQIEKVITNTIDMYGSVKGIAGSAIQPIAALELGPLDETGED